MNESMKMNKDGRRMKDLAPMSRVSHAIIAWHVNSEFPTKRMTFGVEKGGRGGEGEGGGGR